jgi:hypothetical protein
MVLAVDGRRVSIRITAPKGLSFVWREMLDRLAKPSAIPNEFGGEKTISLEELAALERGT